MECGVSSKIILFNCVCGFFIDAMFFVTM